MAQNHTAWSRISPADVTLEWPMKEITSRLLNNFERLSEAPDALPRLRRFVLDLAVRGKLVEQDPNDDPASKALRGINAYGLSNGPFPLPASWAWIDVASVAETRLGKMLDKSKNKGNPRPYLRNINVRWFDFDLTNLLDMPFEDAELAEFELRDGDVLICEGGEPGRGAVWDKGNQDIYFQKAIHRVRFAQVVVPRFFVKALKSSADDGRLTESFTGTGIRHLTGRSLSAYRFPLPPLAEQHRIVAKVDELMALCDRLEAVQKKREEWRDRLNAASLNRINQPAADGEAATSFREHARFHLDHLPRITTRPEHIKFLRQTILDLAVRGKLVDQDASDEPAIECLRSIAGLTSNRKELLNPLAKSESGVRIPASWAWLPMGALIEEMDAGWSPQCENHPRASDEEWAVLKTTAVQSLKFDASQHKKLPEKLQPRPQYEAQIGDILVTRAGPKSRVGVSCVVDVACPRLMISDKLIRFHVLGDLSPRYIALTLNAGFTLQQIEAAKSGMAVMQMNISQNKLRAVPIPLPPIAEQHRIVAKVDELMAVCDQLEAQLNATQTDSRRLLEAVLHEALAPATETALTA